MEKYIKYKRIHEDFHADGIEYKFNELITEGWEIVFYNELLTEVKGIFTVTMVVGKKQNNIL